MNRSSGFHHSVLQAQRGAASLAIAFLVLFIIGAALATALTMSGSAARDAAMSEAQVQALFLAESGIERVAQRLSGIACASLGLEGPFTLGAGSFSVVAPAPYLDAGLCRVRVASKVGQVTRTLDAWLSLSSGGAITYGTSSSNRAITSSLVFSHTVGAGATILLVGVSVEVANTSVDVTYNSQNLTELISVGNGANPSARIFYLLNPPTGSANVVVSLGSSNDVAAGSVSFSGVSATTPFDVPAVSDNGNNQKVASLPITPVTAGAWVFEVVGFSGGKVITPSSLPGQVARWNLRQGEITGAASTIGPITPAATVTPTWTCNDNEKWVQVAAALRPGGGSPQIMRWSEVVN